VDEDPIDFILAQVKDNIKYLQSKGRVSESAANQINNLLVQQSPVTSRAAAPVAATPVRAPAFSPPPSAPVRVPPPPQQQPRVQRVRALYDYNAPGDLNFRAGDVIELVPSPDDNNDWWTGRLNGNTALFPSNYVEKISNFAPPPAAPPNFGMAPNAMPSGGPTYRLPPPPSMSGPPPPINSYNSGAPPFTGYPQQGGPSSTPPPQTATVIVQEVGPDGQPIKKKNKFGKIGSTVGNAAAGGLGFGAGAAIGSGIVNAIF